MDRVHEALIANMKRYREELGNSKMAELCDLSNSFIAEIETGRKFPSSGSIERISTALVSSRITIVALALRFADHFSGRAVSRPAGA